MIQVQEMLQSILRSEFGLTTAPLVSFKSIEMDKTSF